MSDGDVKLHFTYLNITYFKSTMSYVEFPTTNLFLHEHSMNDQSEVLSVFIFTITQQTVDKATAEEKPVFDPASTLTDSEQQQVCLLRIQNFILDSKVDDAVLYYLSAR